MFSRLITRARDEAREAQRAAMARKIGFDAYAERRDMPDPVQQAINSMLDHMHALEEHIARLEARLGPDRDNSDPD